MIRRLLCALFGHDIDMVKWLMASSHAMPVKHTVILRECRRCDAFLNASG